MCINLWCVYSDVWLILKNLNTLTAIYDALMGIHDFKIHWKCLFSSAIPDIDPENRHSGEVTWDVKNGCQPQERDNP